MKKEDLKKSKTINISEKEGKMGLLGNGRGILGIPSDRNWIFILISMLGIGGIFYFYNQGNYLLMSGVIALVLIILSSLGRR